MAHKYPCVLMSDNKMPQLKDILWHPIVLVIFGAGVVWDAPGNIKVRAIFLICLWFFACVDIAWILWNRKWRFYSKSITFCFFGFLVGIAVIQTMGWLLDGKLEEQRRSVE